MPATPMKCHAIGSLNADKALIFRITHINNVRWILANGLYCKSLDVRDPGFVQIGDPDLIAKRGTRGVPIPPGGTLSDYIPFYFTPLSMMMYNINTGYYRRIRQMPNSEIVIMFSSLHRLADNDITAIYTDRHAYMSSARFYSSLEGLKNIDWDILRRRDFKRDSDNPEKLERYQAEALIHRRLPVEQLMGMVCYEADQKSILQEQIEESGMEVEVKVNRGWYF